MAPPFLRRAWVILLLIALLPLRGWAATGMAVPAPVAPVSAEAAAALPPCHAGLAEDELAMLAAEPAPTTHLCSTCDLCHAPLAVPAAELAPPSVPPSVAPAAAHPRDTGRLMAASLERPPRA
jgi:hypothetical protein